MCSGILQHRDGRISVLAELSLPGTCTNDACTHFLDLVDSKGWSLSGLTLYGDATGNARDSTSTMSDWVIVNNRLHNIPGLRNKVPRHNPPIKDTLNAVNAKLRGADGSTALVVDPSCQRLIDDLKGAPWPGDLGPFHAIAWLRYFVEREFPIVSDRTVIGGPIIIT